MALTAGIVGLPNVGKSTLFNAITKAGAEAANYPFATIDPNIGMVEVPDWRLQRLTELVHPKKTVPTTFEFTDIAGIVKGASKGEGLGNQFLSHIRQVDAICHVVRCFDDDNITHVEGRVDPLEDIDTINLELVLADLESINKRYTRVAKVAKTKDKDAVAELAVLDKIKPVDDVADADANHYVQEVRNFAAEENAEVIVVSARAEEEIAELDEEDKAEFLEALGIEESGLDQLIRAAYDLLGLATYFTAGEQEVRAWTFKKGIKAPQAAGIIHSDFERGFIRAETVSFEDLDHYGNMHAAKEAGRVRLEGKDYVVQDGDVMLFRFNV